MSRPNRSKIIGGVSIVIIACLVIVLVLTRHAIDRQLRSWKLLPEPERLTELYFTKPNNLPTTYMPGVAQTVSFTTHNLEYQPTTYTYVVIEQNQAGTLKQTAAVGSFSLQQNKYHTQAVRISLLDLGSRVKVEVDLTNVNESVDYWVNRSGQ